MLRLGGLQTCFELRGWGALQTGSLQKACVAEGRDRSCLRSCWLYAGKQMLRVRNDAAKLMYTDAVRKHKMQGHGGIILLLMASFHFGISVLLMHRQDAPAKPVKLVPHSPSGTTETLWQPSSLQSSSEQISTKPPSASRRVSHETRP